MDLSFLRSEVSLQFKEQEEENRNPGREKETQEKKKKKEYKEALRRRNLPVCSPIFFREERGGKGVK